VFWLKKRAKLDLISMQCTIFILGPQIEFMSADMEDYYTYCLPFVYAMTHVAKVGGCFTTLAVSLERYFAVCKPLWIHIRRCHPANYIVSVVVFAVAFNVPKFLEFEVSISSQ
jgi:hypothetical protein